MRRDPYLIRYLLRKAEEGVGIADDSVEGYRYHMDLLVDGGFITQGLALTWKGAELLDLCRDGDRFKACVNQLKAETGGVNFELLTGMLSNPRIAGAYD